MIGFADRQEGNRQAEASLPPPPNEGTAWYGRKKAAWWRVSAFLIELQNSVPFFLGTR